MIASKWNKVTDFSAGATFPESNQEMMETVMNNIEKAKEEEEAAAAKAASGGGGAAVEAGPGTGSEAEKIFNMMGVFLARGEGKHLMEKVNGILGWEITKKKG